MLGGPMLAVTALGLVVSLVAFWLLRGGADESLNVQGAYLEVLADTLGSVGVIVAAGVIQVTGFRLIDPIFGVALGLFVLPRTWRLGRRAVRVLVQAAPPEVDIDSLRGRLVGLAGVVDVHDLHVWTVTSGMEVASLHLRRDEGSDGHRILDVAQQLLGDQHGIQDATVQVEPVGHLGCDDCEQRSW